MLSEHIVLTFLTYFPAYAVLGWCLEVIYASVTLSIVVFLTALFVLFMVLERCSLSSF